MAKEGLNFGSDVRDGFDADAFNLMFGRSYRKKNERIPQKEKISL